MGDNYKQLKSKITLDIDDHELEILIQELRKGIIIANRQKKEFRAKQLKNIMQRYISIKRKFHQEWEELLLERYID